MLMDKKHNFTFIDLFAGIGGFHLAFHNLGGKCVFASEMDIHARKTYEHNFKEISPELFKNKMFNDDIINVTPSDILLGFFAGTKWNGEYISNGTIVMKKTGDIVGFHIIDLQSLKDYLFENIKLDTPSTTRHRFGKIYKEKNGKLYFKLNLQLRF